MISDAHSTATIAGHYGHDHDRLDDLLQQFVRLNETDPAAASPIFAEFKSGLERHILWEEEILFPIFEDKTGARHSESTALMCWEHTMIKDFLFKIHSQLARQQKALKEDVEAMRSLLQLHNHKEESSLYPALDAVLGPEDQARVFAEMKKY
jgi:iron-sulfur cluster repair protein YtfE (RIC family)